MRQLASSLVAFQALVPGYLEAQQPPLAWAPRNPPGVSKVPDVSQLSCPPYHGSHVAQGQERIWLRSADKGFPVRDLGHVF